MACFCGILGLCQAKDVVHLPVPYIPQPDNQTCLPTSLLMAMHFLGRAPDLNSTAVQALQPRCHYNRRNTPEILRDFGLYGLASWHDLAWTTATVENELRMGRPVVLGLGCSRVGHFVLAIGYTDEHKVIIHDPWKKEPGWPLGGRDFVTDWDVMQWRGGVIIRTEPFPEAPPISGTLVTEKGEPAEDVNSSPGRLAPGQESELVFHVKNNGRQPWPDQVFLAPVDPGSSPTKSRQSPFYVSGAWPSPDHAAVPDKPNLAPGDIATFRVKIRAPQVERDTTFREYWNLVDGNGRWFSSSWLAGPSNRQMWSRIPVTAIRQEALPIEEKTPGGRPQLKWQVKSGGLAMADEATSASPDGSPAMKLLSPGREFDSAWVGSGAWKDYRVEAWVYCEIRPDLKPQGFDRAGIFIRDDGQHTGDTMSTLEAGSSYAMTFDSDDGRIRAGNIENGGMEDFKSKPFRLSAPGWHKFAIACRGDQVVFELDGQPFESAKSKVALAGDCGVYYRTGYYDKSISHGVTFAGFKASQEGVATVASAPGK